MFASSLRRKTMMSGLIASLTLSLFQFAALPAAPAEAAASTGYKIVGYYPSWGAYGRNYNVADIDGSKVTHINYAFADICWNGVHGNPDPAGPNPQTWACQDENSQTINVPNGTVVLGDPWIDTGKRLGGDTWDTPYSGNLNQLRKLKKANPNLKTIISIGGWSWSNRFSDVAASAVTREVFANSAVDFIRKYEMDGVDLDWEYPVSGGLDGNVYRPEDKQNYVLLLQKIREKLNVAGAADNKQYLLTIASGAGPSYVANNELANIAATIDWINIMTYDFNGSWQKISAHNAPLYLDPNAKTSGVPNAETFNVDAAINAYFAAGVPAGKLVLGLPFYGRGWGGCANTGNGQYAACTGVSSTGTWEKGSYDFNDLEANYINKAGYTRYWNDAAKVPYLYNASNQTYISYDDAESIGHKLSYLKSKGLIGAMFWELSSDRNKTLLNKINTDFAGAQPPADKTPPSAPANAVSTAQTSTSVTLSWGASTDNLGVTGYQVYNGTALAATVSGTTATIKGLAPSTTYKFTVKAIDAAGNLSAASNEVTATTQAPIVDKDAPSVPAGLTASVKTQTSITLTWTASTDNVEVTGYDVYNGSALAASVTGTSATISGLKANTAYSFTVKAKDAAGNVSAASSALSVTTQQAYPAWAPNVAYKVGDLAVYSGKVYKVLVAHTSLTGWEPPSAPTLWAVTDLDGSGTGGGGNGGQDTQAPSAPANLASSAKTQTSVTLTWTASTDNTGVTGYDVYNGTGLAASVTGTSATVSGLTANTAYTFTVKAKDAAGNVSAASNAVTVTTEAGTSTGAKPWAANVAYKVGDLVTYSGKTYKALLNHTSLNGWEPANVPALWAVVS